MSGKSTAEKETPLMKQYNQIKAQYPGAILLFRVGDFYETFSEDARVASKVLGIILTKRSNGSASEMELAGFPHHSLDTYLPKLVKAGYRVAVCDQLEDPKATKTIVKRGVTELVTPGVSYNDKVLESKESNYLASLMKMNDVWGLSLLDISTGDFQCTQGDPMFVQKMLSGFKPAEWVLPKKISTEAFETFGKPSSYQFLEDWVYQIEYCEEKLNRQFNTKTLKGFGISDLQSAILSAGAALQYLENTHHTNTGHIQKISRLDETAYVWLDGFTIRNLELVRPIYPEGKSLMEVIDNTSTPMGARLLRNWVLLPLKNKDLIDYRLNLVETFTQNQVLLVHSANKLKDIGDLQRLISKVALKRVNPRELLHLSRSLEAVTNLKETFLESGFPVLAEAAKRISEHGSLRHIIETQISENAPMVVSKGGVFLSSVHSELAELRDLTTNGKDKLIEIQHRESEETGIPSLKIGFNNVFGYYLEVTNVHKDKVPERWIRKQTLSNAERYITPELKTYEEKILSAEDKSLALEAQLWESLIENISQMVHPIQNDAAMVAEWDVLVGFAQLSIEKNYCKPSVHEGLGLELKNCRHPVIESQMPPDQAYIPNDISLNNSDQRMVILTGPNMSGKSAILRQTALSVLLAQIGSFVPCSKAEIGLVDKIYTRVGASDNISLGESTFMVEMSETASILNNISERSLVLLDEIGRGTSTYDGVSLAWSIAEFLQSHPLKPKTLFATHYHELNELEEKAEGIKNFHIEIREQANTIIFLRKLKRGGSEHSFGIHVAQLAGIPNTVLLRASEILTSLEKSRTQQNQRQSLKQMETKPVYQMNMFQTDDPMFTELKKALNQVDINSITPVEALLKLQNMKKLIH